MAETLEQLAADARNLLKSEPGPAGRRKLCARLEQALADETFLRAHLTGTTPERQMLYEDPELGFCILAHCYLQPKQVSQPHDHGSSWAIYGQARGETHMVDWELVEPASEQRPGKARPGRAYTLTAGVAHLYNEGDLHSPSRTGASALIRVEGANMDKMRRCKFEAV